MSAVNNVLDTFSAPARAFPEVAAKRRFFVPLLVLTVCMTGVAMLTIPRMDFETMMSRQLDATGITAQMTPHDRDETVQRMVKLSKVGGYASSVFMPAILVLVTAFASWLGLIVAGGKPGFKETFCVASFAWLPMALKSVLTVPAVLHSARLDPQQASRLLPSNLAALLPRGASPSAVSLASSVDLFSLWMLVLLVIGLAPVAKLSKARTAATMAVLWAAATAVGFALARFGEMAQHLTRKGA